VLALLKDAEALEGTVQLGATSSAGESWGCHFHEVAVAAAEKTTRLSPAEKTTRLSSAKNNKRANRRGVRRTLDLSCIE
jgi:hypothetical protein